jgi:STIP1 family protein 1
MNANDLKVQGNTYFQARRFTDAVSCYTKAIIHDPSIPTYYTNRALCYLKLRMWENASQDCQRALEADPNLVKGHFFNGQALYELELYDEAVASLKKALDLAKEQKLNFGDDISAALRLARKKKWMLLEEKRIQQEIELQIQLNSLVTAEKDRRIEALKRLTPGSCDADIEHVTDEYVKKLQQINDLFVQVDERRKKREVPDILCCKISFEIMRDPVITPSGITYDRKDIEEHLQRVGHFDPITRRDLTQDQLVPNLALKEVIDNFLIENPWAEGY